MRTSASIVSLVAVLVSLAASCGEAAVNAVGCPTATCPTGTQCDAVTGQCLAESTYAPNDGVALALAVAPESTTWLASQAPTTGELFLTRLRGTTVVARLWLDGGPRAHGRIVGRFADVETAHAGLAVVVYEDQTHGALRLARQTTAGFTFELLDDGDGGKAAVGAYTSLVIDGGDGLHVAHHDLTRRQLRVLSTVPGGCAAAGEVGRSIVLPPPPGRAVPEAHYGEHASVGITGDGALVIAFYDRARGNLALARCKSGTVSTRILDGESAEGLDTGDVGRFASLAVDRNGNPAVAYQDVTRGVLKLVRVVQGEYQVAVVDDGDPGPSGLVHRVGESAALAFDAAGRPRVAYADVTARVVRLAWGSALGEWQRVDVATAEPGVGSVGDGIALVSAGSAVTVALGRWTVLGERVASRVSWAVLPHPSAAGAATP